MHNLYAPLNEPLKKDKPWDWTAEFQEVFEKIEKTLTSDLFFTHYNPDLESIVASDTSSYGVEACILQKMTDGTLKPIVHVSKALLPVEKNYLQIKKEALGIIYEVSKFHRYINGQHFTLQKDHKPLLTIFG